ncbi:MAG: septal ring lytic transglycosylase RlpA family protein [Sphingopyxis sp.]
MQLFNKSVLVAGCALFVAGCGVVGGSSGAPRAGTAPVPPAATVPDGPPRVGAPYSIAGRTYTPVDQTDYDEVGYASWYGSELDGEPTASGEAFRPTWVSAAHRTLPLPAYAEVTRLDTGRTILVRINDRGPADPARLIDLSAGAADQLGFTERGMVQVRVRRTNPSESERIALRSGQSVPARLDTPDSLLTILRERAARLPVPRNFNAAPPRPTTPRPAAGNGSANGSATAGATATTIPAGAGPFVVQVGAFSNRASADAMARRLGAQVVEANGLFRVRYGPFNTVTEAEGAVARARSLGQPGAVIQRAP